MKDDVAGDCRGLRCDPGGVLSVVIDPSDLPADDGNPCTVATCDNGAPVHEPAPRSTAQPAGQITGDCSAVVCDGQGGTTSEADLRDRPAPAGPCEVRWCDESGPRSAPAAAGFACGAGQICEAAGACVSCKADGIACQASAECCGRFCDGGQCASCAADRGDCDADSSNGCEQWINHPNWCGACGTNCLGNDRHPDALDVACVEHRCRITRCPIGRVDVDLDFANGCEAAAQLGPGGPYAACSYANRAEDCGPGEACLRVRSLPTLPPLPATTVLYACEEQESDCFCSLPCDGNDDCPPAATGTAAPTCRDGRCVLGCSASYICPDDMKCSALGDGPQVCIH